MIDYYILALSALASLAVGSLVALQDSSSRRNQLFVTLTIVFVSLSTANTLSFNVQLNQLFFIRAVMFSATIGILLMYLLIRAIQSTKLLPNRFMWLMAVFTVFVAVLDWTPILFPGFIVDSPPKPIPGPGAALFVVDFVVMTMLCVWALLGGMKLAEPRMQKQYRLLIIGLIPILVFAPITSFFLPLVFNITSLIILSPLYTFIFTACVGYAIIRHGLFDIKLAAVRTMVYVFSLVVLAGIYYLLAYVTSIVLFGGHTTESVSVSPINIALALVLAFAFQPIKRFFDKITNDIFFRDRYDLEDFYARFSEVLATTTDLKSLLQQAAHEIGTTLKSEQAFFFIRYSEARHLSAGTANHTTIPPSDVDDLDAYVARESSDVIATELLPDAGELRQLLTSHKIALLLPLVHKSEIIGYLALGDQRSGSYTNRDLKVLATISDQLIIAIQNALSVQEIKDINAHLQQRIDAATAELRTTNGHLRRLDATKDEFLSMASHQLRTPLTSVKGHVSMVLEGDAGKVTALQEQLLREAYVSSERMVHLISDFLNVSRLQTGKFVLEKQPTNLAEIIEDEVKSLELTAKSRGIKLKLDISEAPKDELILVDEAKLRQVVMNFIDNAMYYSHEKDTIEVIVRQVKDEAEVTVKDSGIGVPKDEQARLFTKFYRASNARLQRPDGTGVGLFLAKKVIDAHHGSLIFKSTEDKGSTFGFRLPFKAID